MSASRPDLTRLDLIRIVTVETTHPGNIGSAARAMKTMGLSDLRLVRPKIFPSIEATALASGAADLLSQAQVCDSLDAIADADLVIATSARERRIPWPCISARELGIVLQKEPTSHRIAILFGREDRGLTNDELQRCNLHVTIPSNGEYGVLNMAQAVQVICYELRMSLLGEQLDTSNTQSHRYHQMLPELPSDQPPASQQEVQLLLEHLQQLMEKSNFLDPANPGQVVTRLRRLFLRARPDKMEVSILRGVLAALEKHLPPVN
jgi:tRNA (cytidine32/uridine32-2'-O)-methyltransferase